MSENCEEFRSYEVRVHVMSRVNNGGWPRIFFCIFASRTQPMALEVKFTVDQ